LGDGVLLSPTITALNESFPRIAIVLVAKPAVCELYAHDSRIAECISFTPSWFPGPENKHDGWTGFWQTVNILRKVECSVALNTASDTRTNLLVRFSGVGRLISARARHGDWLSSEIVAPELTLKHEAERQLELASAFLGKLLNPYPLRIQVSAEDEASAGALLDEIKGGEKPLAAIHPGANVSFKAWPPERFAEVGRFLVRSKSCRIVVLGAPGQEVALAKSLVESIGPEAVSLAGKMPPRTLLAFLRLCALYVGNDSGPMHLAAAAGCPTVAIFGATNPYRFAPYLTDDLKRVVLSPLFNIDLIDKAREKGKNMLDAVTVDMVIKAIDELWTRVVDRCAPIEVK
jgi:ADP-heptose:LPS heptosyltransferase